MEIAVGAGSPKSPHELNFPQVGVQEPPNQVFMGWRDTDLLHNPSQSPSTPSQGGKPGTRQQLECLGPSCHALSSIWTLAPVLSKPGLPYEGKVLPGTPRPAGGQRSQSNTQQGTQLHTDGKGQGFFPKENHRERLKTQP